MKKIVLLMCVAILGVASANAQFEKGSKTLSGNLTGFGIGMSKVSDGGSLDDVFEFGIKAKGSYFIIDKLALTGGLGFEYQDVKDVDDTNAFNFEVGGRYYFWKYLYGGLAYEGIKVKSEDYESLFRVGVGASLYISEKVFFEPELYFRQGLGDIDIYSSLGISIGIGVNF